MFRALPSSLGLALVFFFGASLLELNAQLYYTTVPPSLAIFGWTILCLGLWFLPSLLVHLHVEYAQVRGLLRAGNTKRIWLVAAYAPAVLTLPWLYASLRLRFDVNAVWTATLVANSNRDAGVYTEGASSVDRAIELQSSGIE